MKKINVIGGIVLSLWLANAGYTSSIESKWNSEAPPIVDTYFSTVGKVRTCEYKLKALNEFRDKVYYKENLFSNKESLFSDYLAKDSAFVEGLDNLIENTKTSVKKELSIAHNSVDSLAENEDVARFLKNRHVFLMRGILPMYGYFLKLE